MKVLENKFLVPPDTSQLSELRDQVYVLCEENNVPSQTIRRMVLAIDEALANVIEHGLSTETSDISLSLSLNDDKIVATIRDHGVPFDPTPDNGGPDQSKFPRRGFGLYLMHLIVDDMEYYRSDSGENVLVLTKSYE